MAPFRQIRCSILLTLGAFAGLGCGGCFRHGLGSGCRTPKFCEGPAQLPAQSLVALTVPTNLQPVCASAARAASKVAALPCRSSPIADMDRNTQSSPACCRGTPSLICPAASKRPQCRGRAGAVFGLCRLSGSTRRITCQPRARFLSLASWWPWSRSFSPRFRLSSCNGARAQVRASAAFYRHLNGLFNRVAISRLPTSKPSRSNADHLPVAVPRISRRCLPPLDPAAAFLLRLSRSGSISPRTRGCRREIVLWVAGPLLIALGAFLVRTRDRITPRTAQCCAVGRWCGRRSLGYRRCLVRMAVGDLPAGGEFHTVHMARPRWKPCGWGAPTEAGPKG